MFNRILIANRGEIALRIIRACRELGAEAVAVYSEADREASYLQLADRAICIGPASPTESYLNIARIISAAEIADVQAIHPGYGFLAENPHFAEICRSCRIEFIGPSVEAMRLLGNKVEARKLARSADVPVVPGSDGVETDEEALEVSARIGYPVIIKAAAGGGGRGMRVAHNDISLRGALHAARAEAEAAFKDGSLYIEKFFERPRHIEVQILADTHGKVVHLWERDCTLQRRHQKLVEESPSPVIDDDQRNALCESAVRLTEATNYHGAGTVEFLYDDQLRQFFFIEANARIQVEHPVTELVTGIDLVAWQIRAAAGEPLGFSQDDIGRSGHAFECRINAEDPDNNFRPCPGRIETFLPPGGPGVRLDTHVHAGYEIPPYYDSLIAKLLVHRPTREEAITTMLRALAEFRIGPVKTTTPFFNKAISHENFRHGQYDTNFVDRTW